MAELSIITIGVLFVGVMLYSVYLLINLSNEKKTNKH